MSWISINDSFSPSRYIHFDQHAYPATVSFQLPLHLQSPNRRGDGAGICAGASGLAAHELPGSGMAATCSALVIIAGIERLFHGTSSFSLWSLGGRRRVSFFFQDISSDLNMFSELNWIIWVKDKVPPGPFLEGHRLYLAFKFPWSWGIQAVENNPCDL